MKLIFCCILTLLISACASKQLPMKANVESIPSDSKLNVTAKVLNDFSDDYNVLLQINFQSLDGKWLRVDEAEIAFDTDDKDPFNIIVGKDLVTWAEAKMEEKKMDNHNQAFGTLAVSTAGGLAAIAGIMSDNENLASLGILTVGAASSYEAYSMMKQSQKEAEGVKLVPDGHLYSPFTIPSMSLSKRWVLINCPSGRIGRILKLRFKTIEGEKFSYNIDLMAKS